MFLTGFAGGDHPCRCFSLTCHPEDHAALKESSSALCRGCDWEAIHPGQDPMGT